MKIYTGIGSRKTPDDILSLMTQIALKLDSQGWLLRSGGAIGADSAFQTGVTNYDNIFLPEKSKKQGIIVEDRSIITDAMNIIHQHHLHEYWEHMINNPSQLSSVRLHTRNVFQILGADLRTPTKMVICWTPDGAKETSETSMQTGGTRTAIRLANVYGIPVFNLKVKEDLERILSFINSSTPKKRAHNHHKNKI